MDGAHWQIARFDLVYYNPRYKRWQFFAEDPGANSGTRKDPNEGLHRHLIRELLNTFRNAVTATVKSLPSDSISPSPQTPNGKSNGHLTLRHPGGEVWKKYKDVFLDYLISTAWFDGVPDEHRETIQNWFDKANTEIPREHALTFLSLLPILEEWDTWGCFIRARKGGDRNVHAFPPPCAKDWAEPFYVVDLDFSKADGQAPSQALLGYPVQLEGLCLNLAEPMPSVYRTPKADFFDSQYCKKPAGEEENTYRLYGLLFDEIMGKLAGENDNKPLRQFIVAYPLAVAGRLHFVQIAIRPPEKEHSCVDCFWNAWQPAHRLLWTPAFRDFLQEEMHRITTAAFQHQVYEHLERAIKDENANPDAATCHEQLAAHIFHLFPVDSVQVGSMVWRYEPYYFQDIKTAQRLLVGERWVRNHAPPKAKGPQANGPSIQIDDYIIKPPEVPATLLEDAQEHRIQEHRIRQSIAQQRQFLDWLPDGLNGAKRAAINDQTLALSMIENWIKKRQECREPNQELPLDIDVLGERISDQESSRPRGREPYSARRAPHSLRRYLVEAFRVANSAPEELDQILLGHLRSLMNPSILLELSQFFETGPARLAVHLGEYRSYSGSVENLKQRWTQHYLPLAQKLLEEVASLGIDTTNFNTLINALDTKVTKCTRIEEMQPDRSGHDLITRYTARLRFHPSNIKLFGQEFTAPPGKSAFRCHVVNPIEVLDPFYQSLVDNQFKGLSETGYYTRKLRRDAPLPLYATGPQGGGRPGVRRVDHYFVFPFKCRLGNFATFLQGSEICTAWGSSCQRVATLHYYEGGTGLAYEIRRAKTGEILSIPDAAAACTFEGDGLGGPSLVVSFGVWRVVEKESVLDQWSEPYSVDVPLVRP